MRENKTCSSYLGVFVAEGVLSRVFNAVELQPYGTHGFDVICGEGYKIDIKSSCRRQHTHGTDSWNFHIRKNKIAEYFLCVAFDNRESLNPEHIWLIPANVVNRSALASISVGTLDKWSQYELPIDKVVECCNTMR